MIMIKTFMMYVSYKFIHVHKCDMIKLRIHITPFFKLPYFHRVSRLLYRMPK